jgi:hypothetical protein
VPATRSRSTLFATPQPRGSMKRACPKPLCRRSSATIAKRFASSTSASARRRSPKRPPRYRIWFRRARAFPPYARPACDGVFPLSPAERAGDELFPDCRSRAWRTSAGYCSWWVGVGVKKIKRDAGARIQGVDEIEAESVPEPGRHRAVEQKGSGAGRTGHALNLAPYSGKNELTGNSCDAGKNMLTGIRGACLFPVKIL